MDEIEKALIGLDDEVKAVARRLDEIRSRFNDLLTSESYRSHMKFLSNENGPKWCKLEQKVHNIAYDLDGEIQSGVFWEWSTT